MGNSVTSENKEPTNKEVKTENLYSRYISIKKLSSSDITELDHLWSCLFQHSFAIIDIDDDGFNVNMNEFGNIFAEFWNQSTDTKQKYAEKEDDQNLPDSRVKANRGYVNQDKMEYLKILKRDTDDKHPLEVKNFKAKWDTAFHSFKTTGWLIFQKIAQNPRNPKAFKDDEMKTVFEAASSMSSLSVNHYFPTAPTEEEKNIGASVREASSEHTDTGLITLIPCGEVPGLLVQDKKSKEWLQIEKMAGKGKFILMLGEKVVWLFSALSSTRHKVEIPFNIERQSVVFLLDVSN